MPTGIEWTDETWNPVTGCTQVSPGCSRCYISRTPPFRKEGRSFQYQGKHAGVTTGVRLHPDRLEQPLKWRKPRRVFVNSLSDLFHEDVPDEFICHVFETMSMCSQLTFQVLTKRPERMKEWFRAWRWRRLPCCSPGYPRDPLPNVWLGTSAENQHWADKRIPLLLQTPAAVRFVSCEPLLGPIDLTVDTEVGPLSWLKRYNLMDNDLTPRIDWVISGGESGPNARPSHPDWFRQLRDQCAEAGVAFFFKQWGEWQPFFTVDGEPPPPLRHAREDEWWNRPDVKVWWSGRSSVPGCDDLYAAEVSVRTGKRRAGALLDGREWREFPEVKQRVCP